MRLKKLYLFLPLVGIFLFSFLYYSSLSISESPSISQPIPYDSNVCISTTGEFEGRLTQPHAGITEIVECDHNVLYNAGAEAIASLLFNAGSSTNFSNITLCNSSFGGNCGTPTAGATEGYNAYVNCGIGPGGIGTVQNNAPLGAGNRSIWYTFTASCNSLSTNVSRLQNTTGQSLAGNSFTATTLQSSDTLTVNWSVWSTGA